MSLPYGVRAYGDRAEALAAKTESDPVACVREIVRTLDTIDHHLAALAKERVRWADALERMVPGDDAVAPEFGPRAPTAAEVRIAMHGFVRLAEAAGLPHEASLHWPRQAEMRREGAK